MGPEPSNGSSLKIPVIDISEASEADTADQLVDAVARYGFVFIKGESIGFTKRVLDDTFALSQGFFSSSIEEKEKCAIQANVIPLRLGIFPVTEPVSHTQRARILVGHQCTQKP